MSEYKVVDLTDDMVAEIAAKFNTTPEEVRRQYEITRSIGPEAAMTEMDSYVTGLEQDIQEVVDDVAARYLSRSDRARAIGEFYQEGFDAITVEEITAAQVGDLFLKLSVALYLLAEAQGQIASLLDGQRRRGHE